MKLIGQRKSGLTQTEEEIMDLLLEANSKYSSELPYDSNKAIRDSELIEWNLAIHRLQDLLAIRILRRDYPDYWR